MVTVELSMRVTYEILDDVLSAVVISYHHDGHKRIRWYSTN